MRTQKGVLLNDDNDLLIISQHDTFGKIKKGIVLGNNLIQNAYIVIKSCQGEIKEDPIIGANLTNFIRSKTNRVAVEKRIKIHLARAGINYEDIKHEIQTYSTI